MEDNEVRGVASVLAFVACAYLPHASGCYRPVFRDCQLECGGTAAGCPDEMVCARGFCRVDLAQGACAARDASLEPEADAGHAVDAHPEVADAGGEPAPDAAGELEIDASAPPAIDAAAPMIDAAEPPAIDAAAPEVIDAAEPPSDAASEMPDAACTCDPITQSCCAVADACDLQDGQPVCREVSAAGLQASVCGSGTQCARGYTCLVDGANGTCHEFCDAQADCQGGGGRCALVVTGTTTRLCTSPCNPVTSAGCESGWACALGFDAAADRWHTDCRPAGSAQSGDPCSTSGECSRGMVCAGTPGRCAGYCEMGASGECAPGETCTTLGSGATIGFFEWGACL